MLERLVEQRRAVSLFAVDHGGINNLTTADWELTERVVHVLQPFYAATLEISSDNACISVMVPVIAMLQGKMQSSTADQGLLQMKAALRDSINRRFATVKESAHVIAATLLDPRFKEAYFSVQEKAAAKNEVLRFLRQHEATAGNDGEQQPQTTPSVPVPD